MKVLSLFSGVGGFDLGLERAGMQTVFQCEWDKHATRILERHWPDVPRWDDVSTLTGKHILQHAPVIDIVAWGSPCQDLSVAGKRAGLDGSRSGLFHQGIRIIKELQEETNGKYPRISLWENVYGALSSNKGADFGVILDEMAEAGALVQEWRVLDAQYFGVPQRRRRVFLVSIFDSATAARCPNPLLPVSQSVRRDTETGGEAQQTATETIEADVGIVDAIGFSHTQGLSAQPSGVAWPTLRKEGSGMAVAYTLRDREGKPGGGKGLLISTESALTLKGSNDMKLFIDGEQKILRRLTPIECERLMGWPDGWTEGQADTHRYQQCGNGVASPVATWIAQHLQQLDKDTNATPTQNPTT
jgi:DNA (cytosine-5)-methyltransferase 1